MHRAGSPWVSGLSAMRFFYRAFTAGARRSSRLKSLCRPATSALGQLFSVVLGIGLYGG